MSLSAIILIFAWKMDVKKCQLATVVRKQTSEHTAMIFLREIGGSRCCGWIYMETSLTILGLTPILCPEKDR